MGGRSQSRTAFLLFACFAIAITVLATTPRRTEADPSKAGANVEQTSGTADPVTDCSGYFLDRFDHASYKGDDGSLEWSTDWIEDDPYGGGPWDGQVEIKNYELNIEDRPDTGMKPGARRTADLSGYDTATLSFDWRVPDAVDPGDEVTLDISVDGVNWVTLEVFSGLDHATDDTYSTDISAFISSTTTIRFRVTKYYGGRHEFFGIDNVRIDVTCNAGSIEEFCVEEYSDTGHAFWIRGIATDLIFEPMSGLFERFDNGTARLTGHISKRSNPDKGFNVVVDLTGEYTDGNWVYYTDFSGILRGTGDWEGAEVEITPRGHDFQWGVGANDKDGDFGASGWFYYKTLKQPDNGDHFYWDDIGDINVDFPECDPIEVCVEEYSDTGHAIWMPDIATDLIFDPDPGEFVSNGDGTATMTGTVRRRSNPNQGFNIIVNLSGEYTDGNFIFYSDFVGMFFGIGEWEGAVIDIFPRGHDFQWGVGANEKDGDLGASGWFEWFLVSQPDSGPHFVHKGDGDFNVDFVDCPQGTPAIDIRKQAEGPDLRVVEPFFPLDWEIAVTNTGDVPLVNVEVTDALLPLCDLFIGDLAVGETVTYTCTEPPLIEAYTNVAVVTGEGAGQTVTDEDPSTVEALR